MELIFDTGAFAVTRIRMFDRLIVINIMSQSGVVQSLYLCAHVRVRIMIFIWRCLVVIVVK